MRRLLAIATLTWKAAFRFRLFWVLATLLLGSVVILPLLLHDDGTARGFIQIMLTYTLSVITALLGFSTLWLACGTLARDIEDCQMQLVAVKPIARWQIWLGKWLGILMLNAALLSLAGAGVYVLLQFRANRLPVLERQILHNEIFVARGSFKEKLPDIEAAVDQEFRNRIRQNPIPESEQNALRNQLREFAKAGIQVVPPGAPRYWNIEIGLRKNLLRDQPLFLRFKFHAARTNATGLYIGAWRVGLPDDPNAYRTVKTFAAETFYEMEVPPVFTRDGRLVVTFQNMNDAALLFPIEDGFEVLYREGGFGLNYIRGLLIIFFWLTLLAALGLAASSFMSFPVAAFFSASLLIVTLSSGTISTVVSEGTVLTVNHETGAYSISALDTILMPMFRALLKLTNLVEGFSPVDSLSTGRSISWETLAWAFTKIVVGMSGFVAIIGISIFSRRELATAQGSQ